MAVPVITSIAPVTGPEAGGTTVTIVGTGLGTVSAVAFGATPATAFSVASAVLAFAVSPAGTGDDHVRVTNPDGTSAATAADLFSYSDALFTVAEARAFDKSQLSSAAEYPDALVIAKEAEVREFLARACGVDFIPTTHTDEYHSGDGTDSLLLDWPLVTAVSAASVRASGTSTWTALTATELAQLEVSDTGMVYREGGYWPAGSRNVKLTYAAGHASVPAAIKRAALLIAVNDTPADNTPWTADGFDAGGTSYTFTRGDGYGGNWSSIPDVMKAIRLYSRALPGIA